MKNNTATAYRQPQYQQVPLPGTSKRVKKIRRLRVSPMALYGAVVCLLVAGALIYLSQYALQAHLNLQLNSLQREVGQLERQNLDLQRQIAQLGSLERIEKVAVEELGMVPAEEIRYVAITEAVQDEATSQELAEYSEGQQEPLAGTIARLWQWSKPAYAEIIWED